MNVRDANQAVRYRYRQVARRLGLAILLVVMIPADATAPAGGSFVMSKHVIAAGGGRVVGGGLDLVGTVGQHEAQNTVSAGPYLLASGFHTPRAPVVPLPDNLFRDGFE